MAKCGQRLINQLETKDGRMMGFSMLVFAVTLAVSITCGVVVEQKITEWENGRLHNEADADRHQLCMQCHLLNNRSSLSIVNVLKKSADQKVCCAKNSEQASALMNELMSAKDNNIDTEHVKILNVENFSMSKASAHKHLSVTILRSRDEPVFLSDENMKLEFDVLKNDPLSELVRNVGIMQTAMVVQQTGMYFIYSSVFFRPDSAKPCVSLAKQIWEHNILLTRNNDAVHSGTIFNSSYKCCDECIGSKETSYIGGYLQLQENDRLHVEVSSDGVVYFDKEASYFGLYMLN